MKTIGKKIEDIYYKRGHYKHLFSRVIGCDKITDYINCIDRAGELFDPFLLKLFFLIAEQTYMESRATNQVCMFIAFLTRLGDSPIDKQTNIC